MQLSKSELRAIKPNRADFLEVERNPVYLVLDSFKVAHNIGTILRMADAILVKKVYICGNTIVPPNRKIKTSSRGAERWVPWEYKTDAFETVKSLKAEGVSIVSVELADNSVDYKEVDYEFPTCLVLGREYDGVSPEILSISDHIVHLPMLGMSNSINVSTAGAVLLYEVYDKIKQKTK